MNILLIFFAIPIAVIIISIALQKILRSPLLVASIIFSVFLVLAFAISNLYYLVAGIIYAIISFTTSLIICLIRRIIRNNNMNFSDYSNTKGILKEFEQIPTIDNGQFEENSLYEDTSIYDGRSGYNINNCSKSGHRFNHIKR